MAPLNFLCAKNLVVDTLVEGAPWDFNTPDAENKYLTIPKSKRRLDMLKPATAWNVYTPVKGVIASKRISKDNPPQTVFGAVADYDMVADSAVVFGYIDQKPANFRPAFFEQSLSKKGRLIWVFECGILMPSAEFCEAFFKLLFEKLGVPTLLAGYDPASTKPSQLWTNGAHWEVVDGAGQDKQEPTHFLSKEFLFGIVCEVSKKLSIFDKGEIPMETIAAKAQEQFPGRWQGDFKLDAQGLRFWDPKADNETGCQVKPDGMLCFTGNEPFVKWEAIFGRDWCEEQKILNLGRAGEGLLFDGKNYWEPSGKRWDSIARCDALLRLTGRGLSDKVPRGATQSDAGRVLSHIQVHNRVIGAAPLINHPPGIVEVDGERILNTANLNPAQPVKGLTGTTADFPFHWGLLSGHFPRPEFLPLDHWLSWLQRGYSMLLDGRPLMGQAIFLCGPKNNGKTLICLHIAKPLLGNRVANPIENMLGETSFNSELFESALWAVNDEDSPATEAARRRMNAKLKGFVVNPSHKFHAKFQKPVTIYWNGRIFVTLNDDPGSVGMLPEVEANTKDKMMFFASQPYKGVFPPQHELEAILAKERPAFCWWLLNVYQTPAEILSHDRMGIKSYYDPVILELSHNQTFASNLGDLIGMWIDQDAYWTDATVKEWRGTPTALLSALQNNPGTAGIAQKWDQQKIAKSLTVLAKQGVNLVRHSIGAGREFIITKNTI
jgi:hypothetical protein